MTYSMIPDRDSDGVNMSPTQAQTIMTTIEQHLIRNDGFLIASGPGPGPLIDCLRGTSDRLAIGIFGPTVCWMNELSCHCPGVIEKGEQWSSLLRTVNSQYVVKTTWIEDEEWKLTETNANDLEKRLEAAARKLWQEGCDVIVIGEIGLWPFYEAVRGTMLRSGIRIINPLIPALRMLVSMLEEGYETPHPKEYR